MSMDWTYVAATGALVWLIILLLPWRPWDTRESVDAVAPPFEEDLSDITALIPARNEAEVIERALSALKAQGRYLTIVVINDGSTDETASTAKRAAQGKLRIVQGKSMPVGWSGKLWALEQGMREVHTPLTLLIDADMELRPGILHVLRQMMNKHDLQFISLMPSLRMVSFWERLLMPPFVYFFKLLYPFRLSNSGSYRTAAAAGGCILLETRILREIDGFKALSDKLIDDCALAKKVKSSGYRTWIGLTHSVRSLRRYDHLTPIWNMVARTAFTQLHYSIVLLVICTILITTVFWLPLAGLMFPLIPAKILSLGALGIMLLSYFPTLRFYGLSRGWALTLPIAGALYLGMTWTSAIRYWKGETSRWKGRSYARRRNENA